MAIITYPLNGIDYDAENAETYLCTRTSGVYSAENNFAASVTGDRQVSISSGLAWIQNTKFAGKSVCSTESVAVEIPIADGTRPRIDRIVLRFDKAANVSSIVLKQGTPSSAPAAPAVERTELVYELGLCTVRVPAASTIVGAGDVTSTLLDDSVCGLMRDGVTGIPTAQLQSQVQALIDELEAEIAGIEQGSEVMLKSVYVDSDDPQPVAKASSAPWSGITGKPATYPPASGTYPDITVGNANNAANAAKWGGLLEYLDIKFDQQPSFLLAHNGATTSDVQPYPINQLTVNHALSASIAGTLSNVLPSKLGGTGQNKTVLQMLTKVVTTDGAGQFALDGYTGNVAAVGSVGSDSASTKCFVGFTDDMDGHVIGHIYQGYDGAPVPNFTVRINILIYSV